MRKIFLFLICISIFLFNSCSERLYFDAAPKQDNQQLKSELQSLLDFSGVYKLNTANIDSTKNEFKSNKFNEYTPPVLDTTFDDTLSYLGAGLFFNRYLEITFDKGVCHSLNFDCINKKIFDQFFLSGTRIIKNKGIPQSEVSAVFDGDSIKIKMHNYQTKKTAADDTTIIIDAWLRGELICFSTKDESYFPASIDFNNIPNTPFKYFTADKGQLYFVKKDTTNNWTKFEISNLQLLPGKFILKTLNHYEATDTILNILGVKYENDLVHYIPSQLSSIFNSGLCSNEVIGERIEGFPPFSDGLNFASIIKKHLIWIVAGFVTLLICGWMIFRRKK